jgi:pyridoxal phosphate enzyme (YggS family)
MRQTLHDLLQALEDAALRAGRPPPRLLAVSKLQPATAVAELAAALRREQPGTRPAFGENSGQEAIGKQDALPGEAIEWHRVGHLQSYKAALAAERFEWVQTVDRVKLVRALAAARDPASVPLNVLLQVNIDDEPGKHGCRPEDVPALAGTVAAEPRLALRGLMAIPRPWPDFGRRRESFRRMRTLFDALRLEHPRVDTLSMGMSDDATEAVAEGATMVRIGSALFGERPAKPDAARPGATQ